MICTSRWTGYGLSIPGNLTIPGRSVIGQLTKVRHVHLSFRLDALFLLGQWSLIFDSILFFLGYRDCVLCVDATYIYCWVLFLIVESTRKGSNTIPFFSLMMKLLYESKTYVINQCTFVLFKSCQYNCFRQMKGDINIFLFLLQPRSLFFTHETFKLANPPTNIF